MNWWKKANIEDFEDRNNVNQRIMKLEEISSKLKYAAKLVYQTARGAKKIVLELSEIKTLDPYEEIKFTLANADKCAIDSPKKFELFCNYAARLVDNEILGLEDVRNEFTNETLPSRLKGLRDE